MFDTVLYLLVYLLYITNKTVQKKQNIDWAGLICIG
jgi:hypothetical protein